MVLSNGRVFKLRRSAITEEEVLLISKCEGGDEDANVYDTLESVI